MNKFLKIARRKLWKFRMLTYSIYLILKPNLTSSNSTGEAIFINIKNGLIYHRYYYILAKYFLLEGYKVYVKPDLALIYRLTTDRDGSFLFKENNVFVKEPKNRKAYFELSDVSVSPDYFRFLFNKDRNENSFHVPIGFHPYIMFKSYDKRDFQVERKRSLFFAGNFYRGNYVNDSLRKYFGIENRVELFDFVRRSKRFKLIKSESEFYSYLQSDEKNNVIIVDRLNDFEIEPKNLISTFQKFDFFLAFPGEVMPLCHNIIEAMYSGSIPFIHESYSQSMRPPLENGVNCIVYRNLEDFDRALEYLFSLVESDIVRIRENVYTYFNDYLSPSSIVNRIVTNKYTKIYLMAEYHSVNLLKDSSS